MPHGPQQRGGGTDSQANAQVWFVSHTSTSHPRLPRSRRPTHLPPLSPALGIRRKAAPRGLLFTFDGVGPCFLVLQDCEFVLQQPSAFLKIGGNADACSVLLRDQVLCRSPRGLVSAEAVEVTALGQ